jgi:drug/metabolite transporter (DMT)-like permease
LLYLIVVGAIGGFSAYVYALKHLPVSFVSLYAYINPIVAVGLGWVLLNERMNGNMLLGTLITLGGVILVNREFKKQIA